MEPNVSFDEQNDIIRWETLGIEGKEQEANVQSVMNTIEDFARQHKRRVRLMVDLSKAGKPTARTRKIIVKTLKQDIFDKVALFGQSIVMRTVVKFMKAAANVSYIEFFDDEASALKWLKEP